MEQLCDVRVADPRGLHIDRRAVPDRPRHDRPDGGQILIYLVEGVRRSPISVRSREIVQQTGLIMIAMLMALAFWNDLSRHWAKFVEWISTAL